MSESKESLVEFRRLLDLLCDGALDDAGYQRIEAIAREVPAARQLYLETVLLHGELQWTYSRLADRPVAHDSVSVEMCEFAAGSTEPECVVVASQDSSRNATTTSPANVASRPGRVFGARNTIRRGRPLLAVAVAAAIVAMVTWILRFGDPAERRNAPQELTVVATMGEEEHCTWSNAYPEVGIGSMLYAGQRLELKSGVARLSFKGGATVLVDSPSAFQLLSDKSLRLERGTVAVRANGPVKDFVVVSPDASIVDLGTSFAVHYDEQSATEVEVFEGSVEVFPEADPTQGHVLAMGANASVRPRSAEVALVAAPPEESRFTTLLTHLWGEMRSASAPNDPQEANDCQVEAEFSDATGSKVVDAFYDTTAGRGWLTPWVAAGNPSGEVVTDGELFGAGNPYLRVRFRESSDRAIAREYGPRGDFDPSRPHIISWRWRLEGDSSGYGDVFFDRVAFYGNPYFRRNSWPTNSWLVGVAGGDEEPRSASEFYAQSSNKFLQDTRGLLTGQNGLPSEPRRVFPKHWFFFNGKDDTAAGAVFDRSNMIDTGMSLKFDVTYGIAVAVYPEEGRYDAAISDDEQTVVRTGMRFRHQGGEAANVFHATIMTLDPKRDVGFSLDSVLIRPLQGTDVERQLEQAALGKPLSD